MFYSIVLLNTTVYVKSCFPNSESENVVIPPIVVGSAVLDLFSRQDSGALSGDNVVGGHTCPIAVESGMC